MYHSTYHTFLYLIIFLEIRHFEALIEIRCGILVSKIETLLKMINIVLPREEA